jgi:hypothetical protein
MSTIPKEIDSNIGQEGQRPNPSYQPDECHCPPLADFGEASQGRQRWRDHRLLVELTLCPSSLFIQGLSTSRNGEGGSQQISEGAQISKKPLTAVFVYVRV